MAINPKIAAIISAAYDRLAEMSVLIVRNFDDGYGQSKAQDILRLRVIKTTKALRLILKFVEFDSDGEFVEVHRISDARINALLTYVTKVADVKNLPVSPKLFYRSSGNIIQGSTPATPLNGSLANGHILVGDGSNNAVARIPSGVIAMTNLGVFSFVAGSIVNADINASAAIAYSKLNLTGGVVNADVNAAAAIAYSKLNLTGGVVNADVNAAAAIAYSKLNLTGAILNADVNAAAAIAYSKLNLTGAILNADVNASAAIARTKLASGTAYRIVANDASGVMSQNAALTADLAIVSDANGQLTTVAGVTTTRVGYLNSLTSNVQTQINSKLTATLTGSATGDTLYYSGAVYVNLAIGTPGQVMVVSGGGLPSWGAPTANGLPTGGMAAQFLTKIDAVDYNAGWTSLTLALVTDVSATAAELNLLQGATISTTELNYVTGLESPLQNQLDGKQSSTLAQNAIWVGNGSNLAAAVSAGTNGYVLTITSGVPTWEPVTPGTPPGANTQVIINDGGAFGADALFVWDKANDRLGIGTASPSFALDVQSSGATVIRSYSSGAAVNVGFNMERTGGTTASWSVYIPSGSTDFRLNNGADRVWVNSTGLGVGIAPAATLHARAFTNNAVALLIEDDGGNDIINAYETGGVRKVDLFTDVTIDGAGGDSWKYDGSLNLQTIVNIAGTASTSIFGGEIQLINVAGSDNLTINNAGFAISGVSDYNIANSSGTVSINGVVISNNTYGTYTPTLTNGTNVAASTPHVCRYYRIGNMVHVSGTVEIDVTAGTTSSNLFMSLPIASAMTTSDQLGGTSFCGDIFGLGASVYADDTNDRAVFVFISQAASLGNQIFTFEFSYQVI